LEILINEYIPLEEIKIAKKANTTPSKYIESLFKKFVKISPVSPGKNSTKNSFNVVIDIENLKAINPIKDSIGIKDNTIEKERWPGSKATTGLFNVSTISFIYFNIFFI
jgi:hypothetical protein